MNRINQAASVKGPDRPTAAIPLDGPARDTRPVSVSANASARARERILDAAQNVFGNRGFNSGSLNEIAKGAGLTRAGVLHHFPSKQAILIALLDRRDAELAELAPVEPQVVPLDQLLTEIAPGIRVILADRQLVQLAHILTAEASGDEHPAHEWVAVRHCRLRATIRRSGSPFARAGGARSDVGSRRGRRPGAGGGGGCREPVAARSRQRRPRADHDDAAQAVGPAGLSPRSRISADRSGMSRLDPPMSSAAAEFGLQELRSSWPARCRPHPASPATCGRPGIGLELDPCAGCPGRRRESFALGARESAGRRGRAAAGPVVRRAPEVRDRAGFAHPVRHAVQRSADHQRLPAVGGGRVGAEVAGERARSVGAIPGGHRRDCRACADDGDLDARPTSPSSSGPVRPSSSARCAPADSPQAAIRSASMPASSPRDRSQRTAALASCSLGRPGLFAAEPVVDTGHRDPGRPRPARTGGTRAGVGRAERAPAAEPPARRRAGRRQPERRVTCRRQVEVELERPDARNARHTGRRTARVRPRR